MSNTLNANNTFYKTYTGTDTLVFIIFPESKPILLGSLTTLSYSIYREKKPVPLLGKINTGGYTRGMRTIAGSMIFTVINQHFVQDVIEQIPYLEAHGRFKADELPFFDVMVVCANEYGANAQMMIYGVEFLDDAQVISINDMFIENTFGFVARDIDMLTAKNPLVKNGGDHNGYGDNSSIKGAYSADTVMPYDFNISGYKEFMKTTLNSTSDNNVYEAQLKLKDLGLLGAATGVFDNETVNAVFEFQKNNDIQETGFLDDITCNILFDNSKDKELIRITNKNGAFVYSDINKENIIGISKYRENYLGNTELDMVNINFYGKNGYIDIQNTDLISDSDIEYFYEDLISDEVIHKIKIKDFDPSKIGTIISTNKETEIKLSSILYFPSGEIYSKSKYINSNNKSPITCVLSSLEDYTKLNELPSTIEFIVTTLNNKSKKWIIEIQQ